MSSEVSKRLLAIRPSVTAARHSVSAVYFAGVMVRLMLTLTPCVCVLSAIAFSTLFERYLKEDDVGGSTNNETNVSNGNGKYLPT